MSANRECKYNCNCGCDADGVIRYSRHKPVAGVVDGQPVNYNLRGNGMPDIKELIDAINELPWARWAQEQMAAAEAEGDEAVDTVGSALPPQHREKMAAVLPPSPPEMREGMRGEKMSRQHAEQAMQYAAAFHQRGEASPSWELCLAKTQYAKPKGEPSDQAVMDWIGRQRENSLTFQQAKEAMMA